MKRLLLLACIACSPRAVPDEPGHPANPGVTTEAPPAETPPDQPPPAETPPAQPPAAETPPSADPKSAFARAKPVLEKHCARCHKKGGKKATKDTLAHFSLDTYPPGGHHAHEVTAKIRLVLGVGPGDKAASMPMDDPGAVQGEELAAILAWADAYDAAAPKDKGAAPKDKGAGGHHHH